MIILKLLAKLSAVAVILLLLTGCKVGEWTGDENATTVAVIGDSLVFQSERASLESNETWITDALVNEGYRAWVTGMIGSTVNSAFVYPNYWNNQQREGVNPDIIVVALGTNDMNMKDGVVAADVEVQRLILRDWLASQPQACVRLIGVAENVWGWGLDITGPVWNNMLAEEASLHPNAEYVAWEPDIAWVHDGEDVHMTVEGRNAYRDHLVAAANSC